MGEEGSACSRGHRPSLAVKTSEGGSICLVCFCNLISCPNSPSVHVSYAISQIAQALGDPLFLHALRQFHAHFLVAPLVDSLSFRSDEEIGRQTIELIADLSAVDGAVARDFIARIADRLSSGELGLGRCHIFTLHCFGMLLDRHADENPSNCIKVKEALVSNLVVGLHLPSEEIRGEILFVLYKLSIPHYADDDELFFRFCPRLLYLAVEALLKTQNDVVRINSLALLTVLARKGHFKDSFDDDKMSNNEKSDNFTQAECSAESSLLSLFADAVKGPLLSSDTQVQIRTLDLIFHSLSPAIDFSRQIGALLEKDVADYVFEILRLAADNDPLLQACVRVLGLLATAEQAFRQRLAMGFTTLVRVLRYVAEIPFHPAQSQVLRLVLTAISNSPGVVSRSQVEELSTIATGMFKRHSNGQMGMLRETFCTLCSTFGLLLEASSSRGIPNLPALVVEALRHAVLSSLNLPSRSDDQLLYALHFVKESYSYWLKNHEADPDVMEMREGLLELCENHILPSLQRFVEEVEEQDIVVGILEIFHLVLQQHDNQSVKFAGSLATSALFHLAFGCLGLYPSVQIKERVYLLLGLVAERLLGCENGKSISETAIDLPSDPLDLLFLLGQKSSNDSSLIRSQSAAFLILYMSSLYNARIADDKQILASLEQYLLVNSFNISNGLAGSLTLTQLIHLYSLSRVAGNEYQTPYCIEAEKILFQLMNRTNWDLFFPRIHKAAITWLFQQDGLTIPLSQQLLNSCRRYNRLHAIDRGSIDEMSEVHIIGELVKSGDNSAARLLVFLVKRLVELNQEDEATAVIDVMTAIINMFPFASNQFLLNGIGDSIHNVYHAADFSPRILLSCSLLFFNLLRPANPQLLSDQTAWLSITIKLISFLAPTLAINKCNHEGHLIISILSLILYHSENQALKEASTAIIFNSTLASSMHAIVQHACSRGPALMDHDEETSTGKTTLLVLFMCYFSLRRLVMNTPDSCRWQDYLPTISTTSALKLPCINCQDICRLIHFGSSSMKLVASHYLLELLIKISEEKRSNPHEIKCSVEYLQSLIALLQGLVFYSDIRVAMNCALCLSMILGWENFGWHEKQAINKDKWCRVIMEELALLLGTPSLASKTFTNQYKPAVYIAAALLKSEPTPRWIKSVFDNACISVIINNLSSINISVEIVQLFRELARSGYLNQEHINRLHHVFQACRQHVYLEIKKKRCAEEKFEQVLDVLENAPNVTRVLQSFMLASNTIVNSHLSQHQKLLEEIEGFIRELNNEIS
ncbi:protein PUTATIVE RECOMBINATION INITIATION DEFECT 1 [Nymphaea colorata]|nr:protein PUTATIVE RECOMBINATION INITIATION DEFECT 1 [Nymphaea colorata]